MRGVLEDVLIHRPDLVCLPEAFTAKGVATRTADDVAEPVPGPTTDMLAALAREHRCHIVCPIYTKRDDLVRNSAILLDRSGDIVGIYDKIQPCTSAADYTELESGVTPGDRLRYFDLDIGRVGILICMDAHFPACWQALAEADVKAVVWPSAFPGGVILNGYARMYQYYVASSVRTGSARVVNPCGALVSETDRTQLYTIADVNLEFMVASYEFNSGIPEAIRATYAHRVRVASYDEERLFLVEPWCDDVDVARLQAEFGFESLTTFLGRHERAYEALRCGRAPSPQRARHRNRPI